MHEHISNEEWIDLVREWIVPLGEVDRSNFRIKIPSGAVAYSDAIIMHSLEVHGAFKHPEKPKWLAVVTYKKLSSDEEPFVAMPPLELAREGKFFINLTVHDGEKINVQRNLFIE